MDLARLADDSILGSDGNIRVVIGLDINYRGKLVGCFQVWKVVQDSKHVEFELYPTLTAPRQGHGFASARI